ncbi:MAG: HAD family phosphatase [Candidatus Bathyarchaeota archaeon]
MFKAVIFDWDETLAHTKDVSVKSFRKILSKINIDVTSEFVEKQMGKSARKILVEILQKFNIDYTADKLDDLLKKRIDAEVELSNQVKLHDGAVEILQALKGKTKLAVATMNDRKVINHMLKQKQLTQFFDVILSSDDVKESKPHPEIFLNCAKELELEPKDCIVIEDSVFGIKAAKKAEMKCIAVSLGAYSKRELEDEGADLTLESLTKKNQILDYILKD